MHKTNSREKNALCTMHVKSSCPHLSTCSLGREQLDTTVHVGSMLMWLESGFAQFAFDLIAMIHGTYEANRLSSFYGIGEDFAEAGEENG